MNKPFDPAAIAAEIQRASIAPDAKRPLFREIPNTAPFPLELSVRPVMSSRPS